MPKKISLIKPQFNYTKNWGIFEMIETEKEREKIKLTDFVLESFCNKLYK